VEVREQGSGNREHGTENSEHHSNISDSHPSDKDKDVARVGHPEIEEQPADDWSASVAESAAIEFRPVTIVNASARKQLKLRIEVPVEDMARLGEQEAIPSGPASQAPKRVSIWNAIHPRLLEIIRERTSTILFVNSRQVAERLAGALNELAGEPIARAHHGSLAAAQRTVIEG